MKETYYSVDQIAQLLSIHPKTVQRYIREGRINAVKLGKSWRVSGHDLSRFTEGTTASDKPAMLTEEHLSARISAVVDLEAGGRERAIQILNAVNALMNAKPYGEGECTVHSQILEPEMLVRITLWGELIPVSVILQSLRAYSG